MHRHHLYQARRFEVRQVRGVDRDAGVGLGGLRKQRAVALQQGNVADLEAAEDQCDGAAAPELRGQTISKQVLPDR
jgi:hypothetical protein